MARTKTRPFSRPVFDREITIHSEHAQRLLDRGFLLVVRALYGIDVVLRIIGDDEEMDQVEELVSEMIQKLQQELADEHARLKELAKSSGCTDQPRYTNPRTMTVHISSPQLAQYTTLITALDALMIEMDSLWLVGVLTNKQRADGAYEWRSKLFGVGREIINLERRARASAERKGKGEEVEAATRESDDTLAEDAGEGDAETPEEQAEAS